MGRTDSRSAWCSWSRQDKSNINPRWSAAGILLFRKKNLYQRLANSLEGVTVDMVHIVVDGMPCRTEAALFAGGILGDDIDAGNLCHLVHGDMVVGDATTFFHGEHAAEAHHLSRAPYLIDDATGITE